MESKIYKYLRPAADRLFRILFRYRFYGVENVPEDGAAILCANHLSMWDPFAVVFALKRMPCFIAKKEIFKNKLLAWICKDLKAFPVDREKMDMKAIKTALKVLKEKYITVDIDVFNGSENATAWGCDLSYDYVKINGDYRS